jgi:hypothetical protein
MFVLEENQRQAKQSNLPLPRSVIKSESLTVLLQMDKRFFQLKTWTFKLW